MHPTDHNMLEKQTIKKRTIDGGIKYAIIPGIMKHRIAQRPIFAKTL